MSALSEMIQMKFVRFSPCRSGSEDFAKICIMFIKLPHFHDTFVGNYQDVAGKYFVMCRVSGDC